MFDRIHNKRKEESPNPSDPSPTVLDFQLEVPIISMTCRLCSIPLPERIFRENFPDESFPFNQMAHFLSILLSLVTIHPHFLPVFSSATKRQRKKKRVDHTVPPLFRQLSHLHHSNQY